jgi:uncharacterized protein
MKITIVVAAPDGPRESILELNDGATVADALRVACVSAEMVGEAVGVWGRVRTPAHVLREGDRVEIYAPLKADPKDARRAKLPKRTQWRKN